MRKLLVISDYDLISGDTCQVDYRGYNSAVAAYYVARRRVREHNKVATEVKLELLPVVFYENGLYYSITQRVLSEKVKAYLAQIEAVDSAKKK